MAGRKTDCTPEVIKMATELVSAGLIYKVVAEGIGIAESTLYDWLKRGEAGEGPFQEFSEAIKKARIEYRLKGLRKIQAAGDIPKHWQAWAWSLQKSFPDEFGDKVTHEHTGTIKHDHRAELLSKLHPVTSEGGSGEGDTEPQ